MSAAMEALAMSTDQTPQAAPSGGLLGELVDRALDAVEKIARIVETLTPAELIEFREDGGGRQLKDAVQKLDAEVVRVFSDHRTDVEYGGQVWFPSRTKAREKWDAEAVVSQIAARTTDWTVDRETGEVLPPVVVATRIVRAVAKACGAMAPSHGFRTTALQSEFGLTKEQIATYRTSEPGSPTIGRRAVRHEREAA